MLGALGLLISVYIKQLENFAGTMNFVIFPMFFISSALYPLWRLQDNGAEFVWWIANINPFTYGVELVRWASLMRNNAIKALAHIGVVFQQITLDLDLTVIENTRASQRAAEAFPP